MSLRHRGWQSRLETTTGRRESMSLAARLADGNSVRGSPAALRHRLSTALL
jgi:hypothetical protein